MGSSCLLDCFGSDFSDGGEVGGGAVEGRRRARLQQVSNVPVAVISMRVCTNVWCAVSPAPVHRVLQLDAARDNEGVEGRMGGGRGGDDGRQVGAAERAGTMCEA